jgi:hypothetical protein
MLQQILFADYHGAGIGARTSLGTAYDDGTGPGTVVLTTTAAVPAGALICVLVCVGGSETSIGTLADSSLNSYVNAKNASSVVAAIFYVKNATAMASGHSITYTIVTPGNAVAMSAFYVTGINTSAPLDTAVGATAFGVSSAATITSGTPAVAGELFVAMLTTGTAVTITQDTTHGWASPPNESDVPSSLKVAGGTQVNAGTGTKIYSPSISTSGWSATVVGFKPA